MGRLVGASRPTGRAQVRLGVVVVQQPEWVLPGFNVGYVDDESIDEGFLRPFGMQKRTKCAVVCVEVPVFKGQEDDHRCGHCERRQLRKRRSYRERECGVDRKIGVH